MLNPPRRESTREQGKRVNGLARTAVRCNGAAMSRMWRICNVLHILLRSAHCNCRRIPFPGTFSRGKGRRCKPRLYRSRLRKKSPLSEKRSPKRLTPNSKIRTYRSGKPLRHPKSSARLTLPQPARGRLLRRRFGRRRDRPIAEGWFPSWPGRRGPGRLRSAVCRDRVRPERWYRAKP